MIRPMTHDDVTAVEQVTGVAFYELDVATRPPGFPAPERRSAERAAGWRRRIGHLIDSDPDGCWVADDEGSVIGAAAALLREGLWGLSTFAVLPRSQAQGVGRALLDKSLSYGGRSCPGMICSSHDPRAARRYRLAGFGLHPAMLLWGSVRRSAIPALPDVQEGGAEDFDLLDEIDRAARGHAHGVDHEAMLVDFRLKVQERSSSRGYAYLHPEGGPYLLAATDAATAQTLLWAALAEADPATPIGYHNLTAQQQWAIDVGLQAGMELHTSGYLALRAMEPPAPYIPSGHFL
jgi:GNAT superfamily N-acetyltransferase